MNKPYIYYKEQCNVCTNKGKCEYEKKTRKFIETIGGVEYLANGVFGSLSFKCDYFNLDELEYSEKMTTETCG